MTFNVNTQVTKWFYVLLSNINNSIQCFIFAFTQLNGFRYCNFTEKFYFLNGLRNCSQILTPLISISCLYAVKWFQELLSNANKSF